MRWRIRPGLGPVGKESSYPDHFMLRYLKLLPPAVIPGACPNPVHPINY